METSKEKGDTYEDFTAEIFTSIKKIEEVGLVKIIKLEQKKKIRNSYGVDREIDIYWEYIDLKDGKQKSLAAECKNYKSSIAIEKIDAFETKCKDLNIDFKLFITKSQYQSGAIENAKHKDIKLLTLRESNKSDTEGRIMKIIFNFKILNNSIKKINVICDTFTENRQIICTQYSKIFVKGKEIATVDNIVFEDSVGKANGEYVVIKEYDEAFIETEIGNVNFNKIEIFYTLSTLQECIKISETAKAILGHMGVGEFFITESGKAIVKNNLE